MFLPVITSPYNIVFSTAKIVCKPNAEQNQAREVGEHFLILCGTGEKGVESTLSDHGAKHQVD